MKKLILGMMALAITAMVSAQNLPVNAKTGKITYMKVIETDNVTAKEAKEVMTKWAAKQSTFSSVTDEASKNFYKARFKVNYPAVKGSINNVGAVNFNLQFFYKDGKFRYIMTDFVHGSKTGSGGKLQNDVPKDGIGRVKQKSWDSIKMQTMKQSEAMVKEFTKAIVEFQNDPARSDDW